MNMPEHKQLFISRWRCPLMTSEFKCTQFFGLRRGERATEPVEARACFVMHSACLPHHILFLPFMGFPNQAYFLNRHHKSSAYQNHKVQVRLSFRAAHQNLHKGFILSPSDVLFLFKFSLSSSVWAQSGRLTLQAQCRTADRTVPSSQIPQPGAAL